jgi:hypothetical protein
LLALIGKRVETLAKKKKPKKLPTLVETIQSIRKDWNGINPVTRIVESKKHKKPKYKKKEYEGYDE